MGANRTNGMHKVPIRDLHQDDIVLVECNIKRFRPANTPGRGWATFQVSFELLTIYVLRSEEAPLRELPAPGPAAVFTGLAD